MQRRHFELIAVALYESHPYADHIGDKASVDQWQADVRAMERMCKGLNARFDEAKFREACGYYR